jgi:hypothetical protein
VIVCVAWIGTQTSAAPPTESTATGGAASQPQAGAPAEDPVTLVAAAIDRQIAARWTEENVEPSPAADDAEFLRRTFLNISGRIPTASEAQQFLDEPGTVKRRRLVDRLLASSAYPTHWADLLRSVIVPEANTDPILQQQAEGFERWLRRRIAQNAGYDRIAAELLTDNPRSGDARFYFLAKANKPENLAASVSRVFLGVRIECAQCHNHPFAKWRREQFWQLAAFFAGAETEMAARPSDLQLAELTIPDTGKRVSARFLDGSTPISKSPKHAPPKELLAQWLTAPSNPYFARAAANRVWAQLMGTGLVDPVDDFDESNPPSHPELLDLLADELVRQKYDIRFLIRAICASRTYQLSSVQTDARQANRRLFARASVKGLAPAELAACLSQAIGEPDDQSGMEANPFIPDQNGSLRSLVMELFKNENVDPVDSETTILQALALMNSHVIEESTAPGRGTTLAALLDAPFLDTAGHIEMLYLSTLSRRPTAQELQRHLAYVEHGGAHAASKPKLGNVFQQMITTDKSKTRSDRDIALGDIFWALLNSSEFLTNH